MVLFVALGGSQWLQMILEVVVGGSWWFNGLGLGSRGFLVVVMVLIGVLASDDCSKCNFSGFQVVVDSYSGGPRGFSVGMTLILCQLCFIFYCH